MSTRHKYLKGYLVALVGELIARGDFRADDHFDAVVKRVMAAIYDDVRTDLKGVLAELGATLAVNGFDMVAGAARSWLGDVLSGARPAAKRAAPGQRKAGKAMMELARDIKRNGRSR